MSDTPPSSSAKSSLLTHWPAMLAVALAGCGGGGTASSASDAITVASTGTETTSAVLKVKPTPTPTPTSTSGPTLGFVATATLSPTLAGLAAIASNFDISNYLVPAWGTGDIPGTGKPDVVGAFRMVCYASHNAWDDPIVYPGQPGKSTHLHTFFGNTKTNGNSTYTSLRTTGDSTCNNLLNRTAYWYPALMNTSGKVVMPDYLIVYYKRRPVSDPECAHEGVACIPMPRGLRFVFGYNMSNPAQGNESYWNCDGNGAVNGHFPDIAQAAKGCPSGARLGAVLSAPSCWNGRDLDSPDHRSHLAYPSYGWWGYEKCPATHPYVIPTLTVGAWFTTDDTLDRSGNESSSARTWYLSSDRMAGMAPSVPGTTFHADWFGAWDDSILQKWTANCIDKLLSCNGGDLGNGQQMKLAAASQYAGMPRLVDAPVKPR